jgi:hypothetical protein
MTERRYSLIGEEMTITIRYGWAILQSMGDPRAALCAPTVTRWKVELELVSWHETYDDAFAAVLVMQAGNTTPDDWKAKKHGRRRKKAQGEAAEQNGGGEAAEPLQISSGPRPPLSERLAAALSRASGRPVADFVDADVVTDGGA